MLQERPVTDQIIVNCLRANYRIETDTLTYLKLGADMNAWVYKAQTQGNSSYFVKLKRGHRHDISFVIASLLHEAGLQQIIPPIKTIHGQFIHRIDDFILAVYPFIEGEDGFSCELTADQWITLGKTLRKVHEIDIPTSIQNQVRREVYSSKWQESVRELYTHIETGLSGDETALKLMEFMKDNKVTILRLVARAEELSQKLKKNPPQCVLCHSDIHGGNVFIAGDDTIYIVDWDEPIIAPKERDLMFIGGGVANVWNKPHEEELFYKGYGKTEVDTTALAYYRYERITEDIALYGQELLLTLSRGADRLEMYKQFMGMFKAGGVVDIAFKTNEK